MSAVLNGHLEDAEKLIEEGADVNAQEPILVAIGATRDPLVLNTVQNHIRYNLNATHS